MSHPAGPTLFLSAQAREAASQLHFQQSALEGLGDVMLAYKYNNTITMWYWITVENLWETAIQVFSAETCTCSSMLHLQCEDRSRLRVIGIADVSVSWTLASLCVSS